MFLFTSESIQLSMVVKSMPINIGRRKTFRSSDFFRNECNFYNKIIPKLIEFQEKRGCANNSIGWMEMPNCLAAYTDGQHDFIALEDLNPDGYRAASRQTGLDLEHCKMLMKILGKFHAVSLAFKDQEPEEFKEILKSIEVIVLY